MKKKLSPILALLLAIVAAFFGYTGLTDDAAAPSEPVSIVQDVTEEATDTLDDPTEDITEAPTEAVTEAPTEAALDPDGTKFVADRNAVMGYDMDDKSLDKATKKSLRKCFSYEVYENTDQLYTQLKCLADFLDDAAKLTGNA